MTQVRIFGRWMQSDGIGEGSPKAGGLIDIRFYGYTQTPTEQRPSDRSQIRTNPDGTWETYRFKNADGDYQSHYTFRFGESIPIKVILPASTPAEIEFSQLAIASTPPTAPNYPSLIALINSQLAGSGLSFPVGGTVGQTLAIVQDTPTRVLGWSTGGGSYTHTQSVDSDLWTVNHNLGYRPDTEVFSVGGEKILAEVLHTSLNQALVYWSAPKSGSVRCS